MSSEFLSIGRKMLVFIMNLFYMDVAKTLSQSYGLLNDLPLSSAHM